MNVLRRLGRGVLTLYFWALVLFLFAPLAALVVFAFNVSATPTLPIVSFSTKWFHAAFADTQLTRREALKQLGLLGLSTTAAGALLTACSSDEHKGAKSAGPAPPADIVNGQGADTDIIVASAKAYLNALNRLHSGVQRLNPQLAA